MAFVDVNYLPGTQKSPQQTQLSKPCFTDTDHVHFPDGRLTTIPPYSLSVFSSDYVEMYGALRSIHAAKLTGDQVGTYFFFATNKRLEVAKNGGLYNITPLQETAAATLGANPLAFASGDSTVIVTYLAHDLAVGDRIKLIGATHTTPAYEDKINKEHIVASVIGINSFTLELSQDAPASGADGGSSIEIFKQIDDGFPDQTVASGFGAGIYSEALYSQGGPAVSAQIFPRIWSFGNFGNEIAMCPGDYQAGDGQKIYGWDGNLEIAPTKLANSPENCNWISVINNAIVALCGRTIRICELGNATVWTGPTTYEKTLERIWKAVSIYAHGEKEGVIFTPNEAILLRYVGGGDLWDLSDLFTEDGILSPMSGCYNGAALEWQGARGFYEYDGGIVRKLKNNQNEDWIIANTNYGKAWKSFAMSDQQNGQAWYFRPMGTDSEPGNYVIHNSEHWTLGKMLRTAAQRPGFVDSAFFMGNGVSESAAAAVYRHFTNGAVTFNWYAESSYAYAGAGDHRMFIDRIIPDSNQSGDLNMRLYTKEYPQGAQQAFGPYTVSASTPYVSIRVAGRLVKLRLEGSSAMTTGAWKMNVREMGLR